MVSTPADTPVTTPVPDTEAWALAVLHTPEAAVSDNVMVEDTQRVDAPPKTAPTPGVVQLHVICH